MLQYIIKRLLALIPILLIVGTFIFMLIRFMPGNPAEVILGQDASEEQISQLEQNLGLDEPVYVQYVKWIGNALKGDLGESIYTGKSVTEEIIGHFEPTLSLTLLAITIALLIALPAAIYAVSKRNTVLEPIFMSVTLIGVSIPEFWLALLLILGFGVMIPIFPVAGYVPILEGFWPWLHHLIIPAFVLSVLEMGIIARMLRDGMLDSINQDYTRTARSKGISERRVLIRHVFPNAMIPTTTVIGLAIATFLGGTIVAETIFTIPGIGHLLIGSIHRRDFPVIQGCILFIVIVYIVINLIVDLLYAVLDPRIRYD